MNVIRISSEVGRWFRDYRESYEWPLNSGRRASEEHINRLRADAHKAVAAGNEDLLQSIFIEIHRWKTNNRQDQTSKYSKTLKSLNRDYFYKLLRFGPFINTHNLGNLIDHLKVKNCNLPVCTAIASFLYGRKKVPILDKFLSQFFARKFKLDSVDEQTNQVISFVRNINFRIEDGGTGSLRLAVYTPNGFKYNLSMYLTKFVPECSRIAEELNESGVGYTDINGQCAEFSPTDVEMAVFSWAIRHSNLF